MCDLDKKKKRNEVYELIHIIFHIPPAPRLRLLVVGGVSFQFFTRLADVFAEEVGDFWMVELLTEGVISCRADDVI